MVLPIERSAAKRQESLLFENDVAQVECLTGLKAVERDFRPVSRTASTAGFVRGSS